MQNIFSFDKKIFSFDNVTWLQEAWSQSSLFINMATVSDSSWEDISSGLVNLLDICKNYSLNANLDFPSAAILFNQLDITVSVLRSVSDGGIWIRYCCVIFWGCHWAERFTISCTWRSRWWKCFGCPVHHDTWERWGERKLYSWVLYP